MKDEKILLQKCSKCGSCGITEIKRQWEQNKLSTHTLLIGYYKCENCPHTWTVELARKIA